ncbi:unnamed protein product [Angiostrongylus costaricensis]|uniref:CPSF_A domain-containing protein n=1 Tax=Angiostrongylus costaricensis TaxID=334426 RepID=A0A0R3PVQ0_ANGCS|nr:unnamed protein product [Angiostrongylus costaricensis]
MLFQLRLPENVNEDIQEDPTALRSLWDRGLLNGASQKVDQVAVFYTGDFVTSLQKTSLVPGANECVIYTTIGGAIGILVPFISKDEYDFFQNLEMHVRANFPPLCGRDHLAFRSYYHPCKNVIDGDLCEQFGLMDAAAQREVTEGLDRTISEEYDFFQNLEMHVRANFPPLCGRDHLAFRSYYHPCKNVIDGDLCEQFGLMDAAAQREVTEGLDRTISEISKKLEDIRTRYAF